MFCAPNSVLQYFHNKLRVGGGGGGGGGGLGLGFDTMFPSLQKASIMCPYQS